MTARWLRWARENPLWSRLLLRLLATLAIGTALVPPLQATCIVLDLPANAGAILGVLAAVLLGRPVGARVADRLGVPRIE